MTARARFVSEIRPHIVVLDYGSAADHARFYAVCIGAQLTTHNAFLPTARSSSDIGTVVRQHRATAVDARTARTAGHSTPSTRS